MGMRKNKKTERHNRVYERNEIAIQSAIVMLIGSHRGRLTARRVAKVAGLSRQTIYNHSINADSAIDEVEKRLLRDFATDIDQQSERLCNLIPDHNTRIFYSAMVFMARKGDLFCSICSDENNRGALFQMIRLLYPKLEIAWLPKGSPAPQIGGKRVNMMVRVLSEIICDWVADTGCDVRRANRYIQRLLRAVNDAASNRLP